MPAVDRVLLPSPVNYGPLWSTGQGVKSIRRVRVMTDRVHMRRNTEIQKFQEGGFPLTTVVTDAKTGAVRDAAEATQ